MISWMLKLGKNVRFLSLLSLIWEKQLENIASLHVYLHTITPDLYLQTTTLNDLYNMNLIDPNIMIFHTRIFPSFKSRKHLPLVKTPIPQPPIHSSTSHSSKTSVGALTSTSQPIPDTNFYSTATQTQISLYTSYPPQFQLISCSSHSVVADRYICERDDDLRWSCSGGSLCGPSDPHPSGLPGWDHPARD